MALVPRVVFHNKTQAAFGFQEVEMEIHVEWQLLDAKGKLLWIDTIKGVGREKMGGPISFEKNTRKQITLAMSDVFTKTHAAILNALKHIE